MKPKKNHLIKLLFVLIGLSFSCKTLKNDIISVIAVQTANGLVSGKYNADNTVMMFKGIPYATPPVGDLRWKVPQPVSNWEGVLKAGDFGPNAMQNPPMAFGVYTEEFLIPQDSEISEDCLYLNVWSSAKSTDAKKPVIVYIHGGGFTSGSGSVPMERHSKY